MSTKVLLKKSSVLGKVPLATDLSYGELALNYADGKLYFKDTANSIKSFNSTVQLGINDLTDVDTSSTSPTVGQVLKWNGTNWVPGDDATVGGTGTDADTLDGFDSSYFLNYNNLSNKPTLFSGSYNDLTNKPFIPTSTSDITNDSGFITSASLTGLATESYVTTAISNLIDGAPTALDTLNELAAALGDDSNFATTISNQLAGKVDSSSLATVATTGSYNDLINKPTLFSGAYADLTGKPTLFSGSYADLTNKPTLFSGSYNDLSDTPTLFSGSYVDLTNKPFIPTKTSDITNDSGYLIALDLIGYVTSSQLSSELSNKQNTLVSGTNIKTINGQSLLGSGDIVITGGITSESDPVYATSSWYTTTNNSSNWDASYGWGDHALAGYLTPTSSIDWSQIVNEPALFSGDYNDLTNKPAIVKAAVQWTTNHTIADGTRYLIGDVVYDGGNIFVANYENESIPTSSTLYWTNIGAGNRLNIDGRDIPNITYAQLTGKPTLFSGDYNDLTNTPTFKTINGNSLLGSGDIVISGGGGGGASALTDLTDVNVTSPTNGQALVYDTASSKWIAQDVSGTLYTNSATTTTLDPSQVVDSFAKTLYRTVKYMIQATSDSEVHSAEVTVMHTDIEVFTTVYNVMYSGAGKLFEVGAAINGTDVDLVVTPLTTGLTVDVTRIGLVTRPIGVSLPEDLESQSYPEIDLETTNYPTIDLN